MAVVRGGIPPQVLQQIRERIDISEIISRFVTLTKTGQNFKGLCPFHSEKTPSFTVSAIRQMFYCFGCGVGGDVFAFLMKKEGLGFLDAVKELAEHANVALPENSTGKIRRSDSTLRKRLEDLHQLAKDWYQKNLWDLPIGEPGRRYLSTRHIQPDILKSFGLGFAPSLWDGLTATFRKEGFSEEELIQSGLCIGKSSSGNRGEGSRRGCYDRFRNRILFPISDSRDRIIAFGGRVLDDSTPKYLNSPETPLFSKSRCLFGLTQALPEINRIGSILLAEGYFDVLALHQAGIRSAVAPLGTAFTKEHVESIRRLARTVFLMFDGDAAGIGAALRTLDVFANSGLTVKVIVLPSGEDPDSFLYTHGSQAFGEIHAQAVPLLQFAVDQCLKAAASSSVEDRVRCADEILRIVSKSNNAIEREEHIRQVAERLGIRQQRLIDRYSALVSLQLRPPDRKEKRTIRLSGLPEKKIPREEKDLISLFLQGVLLPEEVGELSPDLFTLSAYNRILELGLRHTDQDHHVVLADLDSEDTLSEEDRGLIAELSLTAYEFDDVHEYIQGCIGSLKRKRLNLALEELIQRLRVAERENRLHDVERLNIEIDNLREQKAGLAPSMPVRG